MVGVIMAYLLTDRAIAAGGSSVVAVDEDGGSIDGSMTS
jgi:hypothetical protein